MRGGEGWEGGTEKTGQREWDRQDCKRAVEREVWDLEEWKNHIHGNIRTLLFPCLVSSLFLDTCLQFLIPSDTSPQRCL